MPTKEAFTRRILARLEKLQTAYIRQSEAAEPHSKRAAVLDAKLFGAKERTLRAPHWTATETEAGY